MHESTMNTEPETFAVDLSNDGIFLWHRKPAKKWEFVGSVPLDSGNLRRQLEKLRIVARDINAPSYDAIVRIPTSEVQTLTVAHDTDADSSWEVRIVCALEEAAGTSVRTLAFDIDRGDGTSDISIAWVPMAVIKQAETFVHLIGFTPTRYTTDVDATAFPRNPNFQIANYISPTVGQPEELHDLAIQEDIPEAALLEIEPKAEPEVVAPNAIKKQKNGFDTSWFIALFLILALIVAAILYWPGFKQYWPNFMKPTETSMNWVSDRPFFAANENWPANSFEKSKTIL